MVFCQNGLAFDFLMLVLVPAPPSRPTLRVYTDPLHLYRRDLEKVEQFY